MSITFSTTENSDTRYFTNVLYFNTFNRTSIENTTDKVNQTKLLRTSLHTMFYQAKYLDSNNGIHN